MMNIPQRGFSLQEYENRTQRVQKMMQDRNLDAVFLTTEPEIRYFTGFLTQFWLSPTRPWFLIIPLEGKPIAVIPGIGYEGMNQTWLDDIHCWSSPNPQDDGVSLLVSTFKKLPRKSGRLGVQLGLESYVRMPMNDFNKFTGEVNFEMVDIAREIHKIRFVKSVEEIEKIGYICNLASQSFESLPGNIKIGMSEREICRVFKMDVLDRGADDCPYLIAGSGQGGYNDIIMGPGDRKVNEGDVMIIDNGSTWDGYYCDFDRNFAFGKVDEDTKQAYRTVHQSVEAGFKTAKAGVLISDVYQAMKNVLEQAGSLGNDVGRMGHGLGMQLTEWPSLKAINRVNGKKNDPLEEDIVLEVGCVLTLEPGMEYAPGRHMVHEENIVITEEGANFLTRRAPSEIPVVN